jgi:Na+-transporting NADH:ubiquinone oxidoreductase subunit A
MGLHKLKKGLDLPINGSPIQEVKGKVLPKTVALLGEDYIGMKPTFEVNIGDEVKTGQVVFTDKKMPKVKYTSPGTGKVIEINRGEKRVFKSIVIELAGNEEISFSSFNEKELSAISRDQVKNQLLDSGEWTAIRVRPMSKIADPDTVPNSIFITAMDTNPLAPSIEKIIEVHEKYFKAGQIVLSRLTDGKVYLCKNPDSNIPVEKDEKISTEEFSGPHPAGNVGTHIHFVDPVGRKKFVWHLTAHDVIAIGYLFLEGKILTKRIVALAGASVEEPRLIETVKGANLTEITENQLKTGEHRIISGSVLSGRTASGFEQYLGRFHNLISVIEEDKEKRFLGWLSPGVNLYSYKNVVLSKLIPKKKFNFSTAMHGGERAIVPSGAFEEITPIDIIPTYLLRSLAVHDVEEAEKLGLLELDEEDLALCTFVCPSKLNYGPMLRENLTIIEKEG